MVISEVRNAQLESLVCFELRDSFSQDYTQSMSLCRNNFNLSDIEIEDITEKLNSNYSNNKIHILVIKDRDFLVGCAVYYYLSVVQLGYLEFMVVQSEYRGMGFGKSLYKAVLKNLKDNYPDVKGLLLEVKNNNESLENRKFFFSEQGALPIDLSFYSLPAVFKDSGLIFMLHPLSLDFKVTNNFLKSIFYNLSHVLCH